VTYSIASSFFPVAKPRFDLRVLACAAFFILTATIISFAQISEIPNGSTFVVDDAPDQEIVCYGKTVVVKQRAKGVVAIGGDVIVEGTVTGDVGAIGGSVIQKQGAYIGGDVFILGGKYKPESSEPLREEGRETVMYAGYEEEVRDLAQNPTSLLAPHLSLAYFAQRVLSVLFWFAITFALTTIAPGAVGRAVARIQLSTLRIIAIGVGAFLATTVGLIGTLKLLPNDLSAIGVIAGFMAFVLLLLAYVFGRVALHVTAGKVIQSYLPFDKPRSEALTILIGVVTWTVVLSIPYVWTIALFLMFATGIGLVLTSRNSRSWQEIS
jgi:hypothetical protein